MNIFFCRKNKKKRNEKQNVLHNETKDLTFEVSNISINFFFKIISYEEPNIYDILTETR